MGYFILFVVQSLIGLMIWVIIIAAILSWLVAFGVINLRNRYAYQVAHFFEAVSRPILAPFHRIIPTLGGVDISPVIAIILLTGLRNYLVPWIFIPVIRLLGG